MLWLIPSAIRLGLPAYLGALHSHNNLSFVSALERPDLLIAPVFHFFVDWQGTSSILVGLGALGLLYGLWKRNWVPVFGILLSAALIGEGGDWSRWWQPS